MNGNLMLKTGKIEVPEDRYMAPPPSRKGDATYLSPGTPVQANGGKTTVGRFSVEIGKAGRKFKNARNIKVDNPQGVINYRRANNTNQIPGMTYCNPIEIGSVGDYHNSHNRVQDWIKYTKK